MDKRNLQVIFQKYIDRFEFINNKEHDENYKWEIATQFQSFDLNAEDFPYMLDEMRKLSQNMIDNGHQLSFSALVKFSKKEPETVREMFRKLFADEHMDIRTKQNCINEFIESSEILRQKYEPNSHLYVNNQRSVMQYLFLRYPESNYGYKPSQAKSFANCIEFYDDWGPMSDFRLDTYYRMCDQLVEEIKNNDTLLKTHQSRYEDTLRRFHPDTNLRILAFDIIYSSQTYNFYDGMSFTPINTQARKLHFEKIAKAQVLEQAAKKAEKDDDLLTETKTYFIHCFTPGTTVNHRYFGKGSVESCDGSFITIHFNKDNTTQKFGLFISLLNKLLLCDSVDITEKVDLYHDIMKREDQIPSALKKAKEELQPYLEYLD